MAKKPHHTIIGFITRWPFTTNLPRRQVLHGRKTPRPHHLRQPLATLAAKPTAAQLSLLAAPRPGRPSGSAVGLRTVPAGRSAPGPAGGTKAPRLASLRSAAAYRRRPWRARIPSPSPLTDSHRPLKSGPSVSILLRRRARRLAARNSPGRRSGLGRPSTETEEAGLHNLPGRPSNPGPEPVLLSLRRRASPSPMVGCHQFTTAAHQAKYTPAPKSPSWRTSPHHKQAPTRHNHPNNQQGSVAHRAPGAPQPTRKLRQTQMFPTRKPLQTQKLPGRKLPANSAHPAGRAATRKKIRSARQCSPRAQGSLEARHAEVAHRSAES